jgi:hypothetical protein
MAMPGRDNMLYRRSLPLGWEKLNSLKIRRVDSFASVAAEKHI